MEKGKADFAVAFSPKEWEEVKPQYDEFLSSKNDYLQVNLSSGKTATIDHNTVVIAIEVKEVINENNLLN